jgi:endoglucanase
MRRAVLLAGCLSVVMSEPLSAQTLEEAGPTAMEIVSRLGRGINLGNMLDAPNEGDWGTRFEDEYAGIIREAGFRHVRLPVKWSGHASLTAPYKIDDALIERVRHILEVCHEQQLAVVLNMHHYDEIHNNPAAEEARFIALWQQISDAFADAPADVVFELLNEPHGQFTTADWNRMFPKALDVVRRKHPRRGVIVGGAVWNSFSELPALQLPDNDRLLIGTFHYYLPFPFTHQGAEFLGQNMPPVGRAFPAGDGELREMAKHFQQVADWSKATGRPVYLGEFGSYQRAAMPDRVRWTKQVAELAAQHGFSTAYWEFCSGFGAWDPQTQSWRDELRAALIPAADGGRD